MLESIFEGKNVIFAKMRIIFFGIPLKFLFSLVSHQLIVNKKYLKKDKRRSDPWGILL